MFRSKIHKLKSENRLSVAPLVSLNASRLKTYDDRRSNGTSCESVRRCSSIILAICVLLFTILISGCASIKEFCKGIVGVSAKVLEDTRKDALKKEYNFDLAVCRAKIKEILKKSGAYIYWYDPKKDMLALYVSESDTTPVGIFLSSTGEGKTLVEVSSPSTYGKEAIAKVVSDGLIKGIEFVPDKDKEKEKLDAAQKK